MNLIVKVVILSFCFVLINSSPLIKNEENIKLNDKQSLDLKVEDKNAVNNQTESPEKSTLMKKIASFLKLDENKNNIQEIVQTTNNTNSSSDSVPKRTKRQTGFGMPLYDYVGSLTGDYLYDYYDWVCTETNCQLCSVLEGACCDPDNNPNCFLADSCLNNPCLSGGTCITTKTIDNRPDFTCVCLPHLTGKYCQLPNDYFFNLIGGAFAG